VIEKGAKERMHPRNRFRAGYDFGRLAHDNPALAAFVRPNAYGSESIDYADPGAVKALNQALLKQAYGLGAWDIPSGFLCPPIPGRSDYLHYLADLLAESKGGETPRGPAVAVLDIGMGANCIYPLIGASEYGWRFVGSETDPVALRWAMKLVAENPSVRGLIEGRLQPSATDCFKGVVRPGEFFDLSMCNPPFHASAEAAAAGNLRKRKNLGTNASRADALNFGGRRSELWCPGGEPGFVRRMIEQSLDFRDQCGWFTTLVSKSAHLPRFLQALREVKAAEVKVMEMTQGQKQSRILAWTFMSPVGRALLSKASTRRGR
jgi:23S rRNA (adenine1618-N6)-methyltransferase